MAATTNGNANGNADNDYFEYLKDSIDRLQGSTNYNRVATALIPVSATAETITCELTCAEEHCNEKNTMHGGQIVSLVDIVTARGIGITERDMPMVSVDLSTSFLLPIALGETVLIIATVLKKGRSMVFSECEFRRKADNKLCAKGKHTIALLPYLKAQNPNIRQF
uniref:Acyl-coenzyme A thioesterase 13 n=1 Tax=Panagrellus redivivus TaxID=6233 RepID=A0A7E4VZT2_PANRE